MKTHGGRAPQRMKGKQKKNGPGNKRRRKLNENKASESGGDIRKRKKKKTRVHERMFEWITVCVHTLFITESSCVRASGRASRRAPRRTLSGDFDSSCSVRQGDSSRHRLSLLSVDAHN